MVSIANRKTQRAGELLSAPVPRLLNGGFLLLGDSDFPNLPTGACVRIEAVAVSTLQAGDYVLVEGPDCAVPRRFVRHDLNSSIIRLVVTDGLNRDQSIPLVRFAGLIRGVKTDGAAYNPNPQTFLQRAAFTLRHKLARPTPAA